MKRVLIFALLTMFMVLNGFNLHASVAEGEELFVANCKACHNIDMRLVGPALKGVTDRRDSTWIYKFVTSSQTMVKSGDSTAVSLFNEFNKVIMPDQNLSHAQIGSILEYIGTGGKKAQNEGQIPRPVINRGEVITPLQFGQVKFWLPYTATVLIVIALLYYMVEVSSYKEQFEPSDTDED